MNVLDNLLKISGKQRKVKRKYVQKKTGKVIFKEYTYAGKAKDSNKILFRKQGGKYIINEKAWAEFEGRIKKLPISEVERQQQLNQARAIRKEIEHGESIYTTSGQLNRIDIKSLVSRMKSNAVEKYLTNMGLTAEEIALEYNLNPADLLDEMLWNKDVWSGFDLDGNEVILKISFSYDGLNSIQKLN